MKKILIMLSLVIISLMPNILNAEIKRNLAKLIVFPAITGKGAVTLSDAIYDFVGSLVSSFEDKKVLLKYPQYEL